MVGALSTGHQIGLALTGALFIVFSLISSFVLPARWPDFPGRHRNAYLAVCVAFFLAMMAAVVVFGRESKPAEAASSAAPAGDPAKGKQAFTANGCIACHTFTPAGSTAKIGPNLDDISASAQKAGQPLDQYIKTSITDPNAFIAPGYKAGVMPPFSALPSSTVDDLVAFILSGQPGH